MKKEFGGWRRGPLCALLGLNGVILLGCGGSVTDSEAVATDNLAFADYNAGTPHCPDVGLDAEQVYYVCDCRAGAAAGCQPGNDANPGTLAQPFRSYARAVEAFSSLQAGETVAFCRGGSFEISGDREWVNPSCTSAAPCVVRDYDPPWSSAALNKPMLKATSGDGFSFADGGDSDHEEGYTFLNLDIQSTSGGTSGNGFFVYNDIDDVLVCGVDISGFDIGFHVAGSNSPAPGSDGENSGVVLRNSGLSGNGNQGYLGGCDDCGVEHSYFEDNGFRQATLNHNIYLSARGADGMFVLHNELYRSAIVDGKCAGVSLVVHGQQSDLLIEGNYVHEDLGAVEDQCWGIAVDDGYGAESEGFQNVVIRGNTVENVGNLGIGVSACQNCLIENNVVIQEQSWESALIAAPDRERGSNDLPLDAITIRNNTLFARTPSIVKGIALGGEGDGHVVVSNVLSSLGSGPFTCFDYDLPHANYALRESNLCWRSTSGLNWTTTASSLANWRTQSGDDLSSLNANPLFTSTMAGAHDFLPTASSPLVGSGHSASAAYDIVGKLRGTDPDIGAYER